MERNGTDIRDSWEGWFSLFFLIISMNLTCRFWPFLCVRLPDLHSLPANSARNYHGMAIFSSSETNCGMDSYLISFFMSKNELSCIPFSIFVSSECNENVQSSQWIFAENHQKKQKFVFFGGTERNGYIRSVPFRSAGTERNGTESQTERNGTEGV